MCFFCHIFRIPFFFLASYSFSDDRINSDICFGTVLIRGFWLGPCQFLELCRAPAATSSRGQGMCLIVLLWVNTDCQMLSSSFSTIRPQYSSGLYHEDCVITRSDEEDPGFSVTDLRIHQWRMNVRQVLEMWLEVQPARDRPKWVKGWWKMGLHWFWMKSQKPFLECAAITVQRLWSVALPWIPLWMTG